MASALPGTRKIASILVALAVGGLLAGCGHAAETKRATSSSPPTSTPIPAAVDYDISRVDSIRSGFPAGFGVAAYPAKPVGQNDIEGSRVNALSQARIVPPKCRAVVLPHYAEPSLGAEAAGVNARGDRGSIDVVALRSSAPLPAAQKPEGCGLGLVISGPPDVAGPAEQIDAPAVAGGTTTGIKLTPENLNPEYIFTARLDDHTAVVVIGNADAKLNPEQLMANLLAKAITAVSVR